MRSRLTTSNLALQPLRGPSSAIAKMKAIWPSMTPVFFQLPGHVGKVVPESEDGPRDQLPLAMVEKRAQTWPGLQACRPPRQPPGPPGPPGQCLNPAERFLACS